MGEDLVSAWLGYRASPTLPVPNFDPFWLPYNYRMSPERCTELLPSLPPSSKMLPGT